MGYKLFMKLVDYDDKTFLTSPVAYGDASVTFVSGEWSSGAPFLERYGYGITYFDTVEEAVKYAELVIPRTSANDFEVWRVELQEAVKNLPKPLSLTDASLGVIQESRLNWFPGTKMSKRVKPVNRIRLFKGNNLVRDLI